MYEFGNFLIIYVYFEFLVFLYLLLCFELVKNFYVIMNVVFIFRYSGFLVVDR